MHYASLIINYMTFKERKPEHGGYDLVCPCLQYFQYERYPLPDVEYGFFLSL